MLLLAGQLALGPAAALRSWASNLDPLADLTICHSGATADDGASAPALPDHDDAGCPLCVVCCGLVGAALAPASGSKSLVPPRQVANRLASITPAPATSRHLFLAATYPTGPPLLT